VRLLTDLGHTLGITTIAEGVETPCQLAELDRLCVDHVQGFHLGRPQSIRQLVVSARGLGADHRRTVPGVPSPEVSGVPVASGQP
jgi:EAL domain-containing protein (putative c-di-GMP-specific phosphodiesterase class I)